MLTVAQVKSSSVASVAGVNVNDPQFLLYVNDAVRMLMEMGNNGGSRAWWGTVQAIEGVAYDNCFVWPANVAAVLGMDCRHHEVPLRNFWYSFVPVQPHHHHWIREWDGQRNHRNSVAEFIGETCLYRPIATPTIIQVLGISADNGKTITIYGTDANGNEVTQLRPDGSTQRGVVLTIGSTDKTPVAMQTVSAVAKDATVGDLTLVEWESVNGIGETLARYNAGDINPKFLYSKVKGVKMPVCNMSALVKLGFSAVSQDSDIIPLDNIDAIKSMVQSIRSREAGDEQAGDKFEQTALRRLIAQVNNRFPAEQMVVRFNPIGESAIARRSIKSII